MDTHSSHQDNLKDLEQRLKDWQPAHQGLDLEGMLFAAGRASARPGPGRFLWPAATGAMSVVAIILGGWLASERTERLALARQLHEQTPAPLPAPVLVQSSVPAVPAPTTEAPSPVSYLAMSRQMENGGDFGPVLDDPRTGREPETPPQTPVLQVWQGEKAYLP